ncbi:polysaccharide biosynthesis protein [Grimontia sp. S25]|uniref:Polysaccharide biosynthesis protein n=1 Tax=Grimontia sedimenti TaxID=2711294 RepID=A0A6M1RG36_9GAMM|nr:nucleoside-diphosphate sugar epimerase/dehydratase [Grimontia sedimenti]NGN98462.1 polysaccharide biosynthesis protein [Grimontia sedimenti]
MNFLDTIFDLSRIKKRFISVLIDIVFIFISFYAAYWVRIGDIVKINSPKIPYLLVGVIAVTIFGFMKLGLYRAVLRYLTFHALAVVSFGTLISAASVAVLAFYLSAPIPRSLPIIYGAFLCLLCGGSRLIVRVLVYQVGGRGKKPVLIYGAGSAGRQLALSLRNSDSHRVVGFVDQDRTLIGTVIMGINVCPLSRAKHLVERHEVKQILLAVPSASHSRRKEILDLLVPLAAEVLTVPDMKDIVEGRAKIDELKDVDIEDLLGRDPVEPQLGLMQAKIHNKVVMVTGAGGSIGSELCRQIIKQNPKSLLLFEISEYGLYKIERELTATLKKQQIDVKIVPLLGSVQSYKRLLICMQTFGVQTVYHAAAYKHVPLVEYNVIEGVQNNIFGTYNAAKSALASGVSDFVLISTDKAVRPTNIMGATKRMAELCLQALSEANGVNGDTCFSMVRFGNVLGSSGSVIPLFKKQIRAGGPVTVTHPDIIRYFMTIPEAAQLVIQAGAMAKGGDVFVLDMGEPVKITDLAENLVRLSGLELKSEQNPHGEIGIEYTGLRPGEKLYEELLIGSNVQTTAHERIMTAKEVFLPESDYESIIERLRQACENFDQQALVQILLEAPTDFSPNQSIISDLVWNESTSEFREQRLYSKGLH